jgi:hypothetical protein
MRTTIHLDDGLLDDAKRRASEEGTTLTQILTRALRHELARPRTPRRASPFRLVTYGSGGLVPGLTVERIPEVLEAEDVVGVIPVGAPLRGKGPRSQR